MLIEPFWQPRFVGRRFDEHTIPLLVLRDLAVLEDLLFATASWLFRKENPGRKRTPKGFRGSVGLSIATIEEGSAAPTIVLTDFAVDELFPSEGVRFFRLAKEGIINLIEKASGGDQAVFDFPDTLLRYFDQLGRSLRDDEAIEFNPSDSFHPARLTPITRKSLALAASSVKEFTEEVSVRGSVPEVDQQKKSFTLSTLDGRRIEAPLHDHIFPDVMAAFSSYQDKARILVHGIQIQTRTGSVKAFKDIEYVESLEELDISTRLEEISLLSDGWLDGKGRGFNKETLKALVELFEHGYPDRLPLPYLYPTAEGGIQAEWDGSSWSVSLEIELPQLQAKYHGLSKKTDETFESVFVLSDPEEWKLFLGKLAEDVGVAE